jgi:hypothetical protein
MKATFFYLQINIYMALVSELEEYTICLPHLEICRMGEKGSACLSREQTPTVKNKLLDKKIKTHTPMALLMVQQSFVLAFSC